MENLNNQGKTQQQGIDSITFFYYATIGLFTLMLVMTLLSGCAKKTHVITEYDGDREIRWYSTDK